MNIEMLSDIQCLYKKSDQLLATGRFGEGLWPVALESGHFMNSLIRFFRLKRGLEVGAGVGYSSAWFVDAFQEMKGNLTTLEYYWPKVEQWERHMGSLFGQDYEQNVQIVPSDFNRWIRHSGRQKFDFVFFDQRKEHYLEHLKMLMPKLKKGAFICADNVLSHARECQNYLEFLRNEPKFDSFTLSLGDGLEITRYMG